MQTDEVIDGQVVDEGGQAHSPPAGGAADPAGEAPPAATPGVALELAATPVGAIIAANEPREILAKAQAIAAPLKELIESAGLAVNLDRRNPNRKHVEVGGWQAAGTMLGALGGLPLHAETEWTRRVADEIGGFHRTRYTAEVKRYFKRDQGGGLRETVSYDVDGFDWEARVAIKTPAGVTVGIAEAMVSRAEETWSRRDDYALRSMAETRAESRAWRKACGWIVNMAGYNPTPAEEMGHTPGADTSPAPTSPAIGEDQKARLVEALKALTGIADKQVMTNLWQRLRGDRERPSVEAMRIVELIEEYAVAAGTDRTPAVDASDNRSLGQITQDETDSIENAETPVFDELEGERLAALEAAREAGAVETAAQPGTPEKWQAAGLATDPRPRYGESPAQSFGRMRGGGCTCTLPFMSHGKPPVFDEACPLHGVDAPSTQ